jgi:hypothetical protein
MEHAKRHATPRATGVSNVAYDLTTILTNKLQGAAAFEEYKLDAQEAGDQEAMQLLEQLEQREVEDIGKLKSLVAQRLR